MQKSRPNKGLRVQAAEGGALGCQGLAAEFYQMTGAKRQQFLITYEKKANGPRF